MESSVDKKHFIGSMSKSLENLPQWYQIGALCGVLIAIYLHNTFFISWLVMNLHNPLGTSWIWYPEYQEVLKHLSFKGRICFSLYGVSLSIIVVLLYSVFCHERFKIGSPLSQLFPDRKGLTALMCVLLCLVEMIRMHEVIIECFTRENSIASIALKRLGSGASSNSKNKKSFHFVVQVELLKAFLLRMLPQQVMVMLVAMVYRLFRDIPRKIYVALRWDMVTIAFVHSIGNVISILFLHSKPTLSTWAIIGWPFILLGTINYLYGSSKRAGMVVTISSSYTLTKTFRGLIMCVALRNIISLLALSLLVSVHVVELITIWFMLILIILWIPAIIDSCSLEGIIFVTSSSSIMLYFMDQLSIPAALRLGLMVMLWWLNVSLLYNLAVNIFHTRYAGISVVLCLFLWTILPPKQKKEPWGWAVHQGLTAGKVMLTSQSGNGTIIGASTPMIDTVLQQKIKWMCDVAELRAPFECKTIWLSQFVRSNEGCGTYHYVIFVNLGLSIILVTLLTFLSAFQSPEVRLRLEQNNLVLVTAGILIRKFARAIVITFCVVSFLASWWAFHQCILPYFTPILPSLVSHVVSGVFACITLGALMDMKDTMYEGILQVLGLMDPEEYNQESSS